MKRRIFTGRNEVVAKVMFLQVSVILSTGGGSPENPPLDQADPPRTKENPPSPRTKENPPRTKENPPPPDQENPPWTKENPPPPPDQGEPPPRTKENPPPDQADPPPPGRRLQHTVNERPVRILLECNLVSLCACFQIKVHNGVYIYCRFRMKRRKLY